MGDLGIKKFSGLLYKFISVSLKICHSQNTKGLFNYAIFQSRYSDLGKQDEGPLTGTRKKLKSQEQKSVTKDFLLLVIEI